MMPKHGQDRYTLEFSHEDKTHNVARLLVGRPMHCADCSKPATFLVALTDIFGFVMDDSLRLQCPYHMEQHAKTAREILQEGR